MVWQNNSDSANLSQPANFDEMQGRAEHRSGAYKIVREHRSAGSDAADRKVSGLPINTSEPRIMHIDLNSCFAMLEQQANPLLRNKPVAVAAYEHDHGIVLAASYEAKALGIKLGTPVWEARKIYPEIVILMPDPPKYRQAHKLFKKVLLGYTSAVQPRSIDEFVVDFSGSETLRSGKSLEEVGYQIKQDIKGSLGSYVTVNVGIGPNRFLAKLAAGLHKPDGLDIITHKNLLDVYDSLQLMDLPGINRRYRARLLAAGIASPLEFFLADADYLKSAVFRSVVAHYWHQRLRGWEVDATERARKTIGHQYALQQKTADPAELAKLLMKLSEKVGRRLRSQASAAQGIHLALRFIDHTWWHHGTKLPRALYATQDIYAATQALLAQAQIVDKVSLISITTYSLRPVEPEQLGLFETDLLKKRALTQAADQANDRYGEFTVVPAIMSNMDKTILDRIAFGSTAP